MSRYTYAGTSRTVELATGAMHYHEAGEGPVLLLLHGSGPGVTGWANFGGNLDFFAQHFRCIVPDLPGYGRSAPVAGAPVPATAEAVVKFAEALGVRSAHVIGNSYGAIVGARLAADAPQFVERLVCIGGIGFNIFSSFPGEGLTRLVDFIEDPTRERLAAWLRSMVYDKAIITEQLLEERYAQALEPVTMETSRKMYTRQALEMIGEMRRGPDAVQDFAHLPKIQAPTLLTWGRDDRVNPLDCALGPMRLIPNCELHIFPNCGHWAMIERRQEFQRITLEFLQRDGAAAAQAAA